MNLHTSLFLDEELTREGVADGPTAQAAAMLLAGQSAHAVRVRLFGSAASPEADPSMSLARRVAGRARGRQADAARRAKRGARGAQNECDVSCPSPTRRPKPERLPASRRRAPGPRLPVPPADAKLARPLPVVHVAMLCHRRPDHARRTAQSWLRFNANPERFRLWAAQDGGRGRTVPEPGIPPMLDALGWRVLFRNERNGGVVASWTRLVHAVASYAGPDDLILTLEEDWACTRPLTDGLIAGMAARPDVGSLLLVGAYREEGGNRRAPLWHQHNARGMQVQIWGGEFVLVGPSHFGFPPRLSRIDHAVEMLAGARSEAEVWNRGFKSARPTACVAQELFWHIGYDGGWREVGGRE